MAVLPVLASTNVPLPRSIPRASAASSIDITIRSFTLPLGFCPSSLAKMRTPGLGAIPRSSTSGVRPTSEGKD